jgi:hypothetical protein
VLYAVIFVIDARVAVFFCENTPEFFKTVNDHLAREVRGVLYVIYRVRQAVPTVAFEHNAKQVVTRPVIDSFDQLDDV